jgi:hypothetical protein
LAITIHCTSVRVQENGGYNISWSDGNGNEYSDFQSLSDYAAFVDSVTNTDLARQIMLRLWLQADPTGQDLNQILGRQITIDFTLANPVQVVDR